MPTAFGWHSALRRGDCYPLARFMRRVRHLSPDRVFLMSGWPKDGLYHVSTFRFETHRPTPAQRRT
jgi:hypothetical protein